MIINCKECLQDYEIEIGETNIKMVNCRWCCASQVITQYKETDKIYVMVFSFDTGYLLERDKDGKFHQRF